MTFSKYKKTVIACILALGIGVGGGYYFFGSPVNTQPTNVREQTKQTKPITETRNTYVEQINMLWRGLEMGRLQYHCLMAVR